MERLFYTILVAMLGLGQMTVVPSSHGHRADPLASPTQNEEAAALPSAQNTDDVDEPSTLFIPANLFMLPPKIRHVAISPDGKYISFAVRTRDTTVADIARLQKRARTKKQTQDWVSQVIPSDELRIISLETGELYEAVPFENRSIAGAQWASPDHLLVTFTLPFTYNGSRFVWTVTGYRTLSMNVRTKEAVTLFQDKRRVRTNLQNSLALVHKLPGDPEHVMMQIEVNDRLDLYRVNIVTGDSERIGRGRIGTTRWITRPDGTPLFRLDFNRRETELFTFLSRDDGKWEKIAETPVRQDRKTSVSFQPLGYRDGKIYILNREETENFVTIKTFDPLTQTLSPSTLIADDVDLSGGLIDTTTGELLGGYFYNDYLELRFFDDTRNEALQILKSHFGNGVNIILEDVSESRDAMLIAVSGPDTPLSYYLFTPKTRALEKLFQARSTVPEEELSPTKAIQYTARDGTKLRGYLTSPRHSNGPAPLIVFPHGGPSARDFIEFDPLVQFLAHRGYAVFQPQFRGSSGFGKAFNEAGFKQWGALIQDDIHDGVSAVKKLPTVDGDRVCIAGGSFGGYAALANVIRYPATYKCAMSFAGVFNLPKLLKFVRREDGAQSSVYKYVRKSIGDPSKDEIMLRRQSPALNAALVPVPVLLIHGENDRVTPASQSEEMATALEAAGQPHTLKIVENEGHGFIVLSNQAALAEALADFSDVHLLGKDPGVLPPSVE